MEEIKLLENKPLPTDRVIELVHHAPALPSEEEKKLSRIEQLYESCVIDPTKDYPGGEYLISIGGVPCFPTGNVCVLDGKPKVGKTTVLAIIIAALINGEVWDGYVKSEKPNIKTIYFDADEVKEDSKELNKRILNVAGLPIQLMRDKVDIVNIRLQSVQDRLDLLELAAKRNPGSFIVLDNARHFLANKSVNDEKECTELMDRLIRLATERNCCIMPVIHDNKSNADPSGWLARVFLDFCSDSYTVMNKGGIRTFKTRLCRHKEPPEICFAFDDEGNVIPFDELIAEKLAEKKKAKDDAHLAELQAVQAYVYNYLFSVEGNKAIQADIARLLIDNRHYGRTVAYDLLKELRERNMIPYDGKYFYISNENTQEPVDETI